MKENILKNISKYVISVSENRYLKFKQYTDDLGIGHIHRLPVKITKNRHWIGAGLSHQDCVRHAMENDSKYAMVFEDDCRFNTGYEPTLDKVIDYINNNNDWEYISLGHTFIYCLSKPGSPNIDKAKILKADNRFNRVNDTLIKININDLPGPVVGNSCCVIYNHTGYEKYLNDFDPYKHEWCDVWAPKNLKTLLVSPTLVNQNNKPWMKNHSKVWCDFLNTIT